MSEIEKKQIEIEELIRERDAIEHRIAMLKRDIFFLEDPQAAADHYFFTPN